MSVHRYWRLRRLLSPLGSAYALSEAQLIDGVTRQDAGATLTASAAPLSGSLASLADGAAVDVVLMPSGAVLQWDLGSAAEVNNIRLGAGGSTLAFPVVAWLEWSDDASAWTLERVFERISYPGDFALTDSLPPGWRIDLGKVYGQAGIDYDATRQIATLKSTSGGVHVVGPPIVGNLSARQLEFTWLSPPSTLAGAYVSFGIGDDYEAFVQQGLIGASNLGFGFRAYEALKTRNNSASAYGSAGDVNDVFGLVYDGAGGSITLYKNGVSLGVAFSGLAADIGDRLIYPLANSGSQGNFPLRLKLNGFDFPIDGVAPWSSSTQSIRREGINPARQARVQRFYQPGGAVPNFSGLRQAPIFKKGPFGADLAVGVGYIRSTVKKKSDPVNLPLRRRVRLYSEIDGRLLRETWSRASDGMYEFLNLDPTARYTVVAYDYEHNYRASIADNLTATVDA